MPTSSPHPAGAGTRSRRGEAARRPEQSTERAPLSLGQFCRLLSRRSVEDPARRGWDSNPRNGLPLGRFQGACTSPLCDLAPAQLDGSSPQDPRIVAEALDGRLGRVKAIVAREAGAPEVLELAELPTPEAGPRPLPGEGTAAGVNRADLLQRRGHYPPPPGASPLIGLEVSGQVAGLGEGVSGWAVGDPCVALLAGGGYAEYVAVPAGQVIPPPPRLSLVEAAGVVEV